MCLESWPIETAASSDATSAKITDSGAPPPLNAIPAGIDNAVAIAGAMNVMDWKSTPLKPTAPRPQTLGSVFTSNFGHRALPSRSDPSATPPDFSARWSCLPVGRGRSGATMYACGALR